MSAASATRRDFLKYIGAGVVGLAIGSAVGYSAAPPKVKVVEKPVEKVVEKPVGVVKGPIRIGVGTFLSGPFVSEGEHLVNVAKLAVKEVEEAGWFPGAELELYFADLGSVTPDEVKKAVEKLVYVNKTHFNVAYWGTYGPGWDITLKSGIPLYTGDSPVGVAKFVAEHPEARIVLNGGGIDSSRWGRTFAGVIEWLAKEGLWTPRHKPLTVYIVSSDFVWDTDMVKMTRPIFEEKGWSVVGYDMSPLGTLDWTAILSKIRAADPDVIWLSILAPADMGTFISQFTANPTKSLILGSWGGAYPEFLQVADPKSLLGALWGGGPMFNIKDPLYITWRSKYRELYGKDPTFGATVVYDGINIMLKAIRYAGTTDPEKMYDAVFKIAHRGLLGLYVYDRETKLQYAYPEFVPHKVMQVQEKDGVIGQYWIVYPAKAANASFQLPWWLK